MSTKRWRADEHRQRTETTDASQRNTNVRSKSNEILICCAAKSNKIQICAKSNIHKVSARMTGDTSQEDRDKSKSLCEGQRQICKYKYKLDNSKLCEFCIYRVFLIRTSLLNSVSVNIKLWKNSWTNRWKNQWKKSV